MDRVGFLIEDSGERLGCMLNPETLEISRIAGLKPRRGASGVLTGRGLKDDALLFTGGGTTELKLDLLFDVGLAGSSIQTEDVRDLTSPLWQLAENAADDSGSARLRRVRFVWGKAWNIPGVVAAIAERFEDFTIGGIPRRSWLRLRFLRVEAPVPAMAAGRTDGGSPGSVAEDNLPAPVRTREVVGGPRSPEEGGVSGERLDAMAQRAYGDSSLWRWLANCNGIDNPLQIPAGQVMQLPPVNRGDASA